MKIPVEFYNYLRMQVRISDIIKQKIKLTRKGMEYLGLCPFHQEKTPSFTVNDSKRFYHCFGCGAHGDIIRFVSETTGISYQQAAIKIAEDHSLPLPKMTKEQEKIYEEADEIYKISALASQFFMAQLKSNNKVKDYLDGRGVGTSTIDKFLIGYASSGGKLIQFFESKSIPVHDLLKSGLVGKGEDGKIYEIFNNRIIFPIRNIYNKIVGFGGRVIGDGLPKYLNSPETIVFKKSETMYGENFAISAAYKKNYSIIVEGYLDAIALHEAGFPESVASLGTSVTEGHLQKLWHSGKEIVICLDGDAAGVRASNRLINISLAHVNADQLISFVQLPQDLDPDDVIKKGGQELFQKLLDQRIGLSEMIWRTEFDGKTFNSAESKAILEKILSDYCVKITDKPLAANFRRYFKEQIWNNLIRRKPIRKEELRINSEVIAGRNYSELEMLEHALFAFMIKYPQLANADEPRNFLLELNFEEKGFNEFRDWFFEQFAGLETITEQTLARLVENTRFYNKFLVLSDPDKLFLDQLFLNKNIDNQSLFFEWLRKKYYLAHLKQEYSKLFNNNLEGSEVRAFSYLNEIQKTSKELAQLNEFFIK